jgi:gamma-D-glutamyl-L-lysine dipeptidyl-peptidase
MEIIDFGVCRLSIAPVRSEPAEITEQVTQLLFGDHYVVNERSKDRKWLRITTHFDHYSGWISVNQHQAISKEYFDHVNNSEFKITTDITASLLYNKSPLVVLLGSIIPISSAELFKMEEQFAFNGETKNLGLKRDFEYLRGIAQKYLNAPYLWGGKSPFGIDCSGFTQMVFKICGYNLLRDASQQALQGKAVRDFIESKPGDLLFFQNEEGKIIHTGILFGPDRIIHASGKVRIDQVNEEGILNTETKVYTHRFAHIRRIFSD